MYVEIDDDLAAVIEQHMRLDETHDEVVRRLLRRALANSPTAKVAGSSTSRSRTVIRGSVADLLRAGFVSAGDELQFREVRRDITHIARIEPDGRVRTPDGTQGSPSATLGALVGYSVNGWKMWVHAPTGKTLSALRDGLGS